MSATRILTLLLWAFATCSVLAEERVPFTVQVRGQGALVFSGPGDEFYATEKLGPGEEVEVWRRRAGGWLAIRPPKTSYSLVAARGLRRVPGTEVAEVSEDDTVSWIGSTLGHDGDYRWQVRLDVGERVVILGDEELRLRPVAPAESLCRIAPPSGEFRWVHERDLVSSTPSPPAGIDPAVQLADFRVAVDEETAPPPARRDSFVARKKSTGSSASPVAESLVEERRQTSSQAERSASGGAYETLDALEVQLSIAASQPVERWDFAKLRAQAQRLADHGSSTLDRARACRFLEQVEEFDQFKTRSARLGSSDSEVDDATSQNREGESSPATDDSLLDPRFDGTGWLLPVHSTRRSAPPYALLDQEGRILQFISPAPGMNLHRYLRKEIGVYGQRSYISALEKPHITAHRVVDLDRHRR